MSSGGSPRPWEVLLVGGASGVGKTRLVDALSERYAVPVTEVDDLQTFLEAVSTPEQQPLVHLWRVDWDAFAAMSDAERVAYFVRLSREVFQPGLVAVVEDHLEGGRPTILCGAFVLPELSTLSSYGDQPNSGRVTGFVVAEPDEAQIAANFDGREGDPQHFRAHASLVNQTWLLDESVRLGVPVVEARPWATAAERTAAVLSEGPPSA